MEVEMMKALAMAGGYAAIGLAAMGSAMGTGIGGSAAIGAWKKCYQQDKPAPFLLIALAGAPLSQTIYGMILMILIKGKMADNPAAWPLYLTIGVLGGLGLMFSAWYQGKAARRRLQRFRRNQSGLCELSDGARHRRNHRDLRARLRVAGDVIARGIAPAGRVPV